MKLASEHWVVQLIEFRMLSHQRILAKEWLAKPSNIQPESSSEVTGRSILGM